MSIFNRLRSYQFDWKSSGQGLPMNCQVIGSKAAGMFLSAIGIFFLLTPLQLVIAAAPAASREISAISFYHFSGFFFGLVIVYIGVGEFLTRKSYTITTEYVEFRRRGILPKSWKVPIKQYRGVIQNSEPSKGNQKSPKGIHTLALRHGYDEKKDVPLYVSTSPEDLDQKWKHFSKMFSKLIADERYDGWCWQ